MKYCQKCGKEIDDNSVFCIHCGGEQQIINTPSPQNGNSRFSFFLNSLKSMNKLTWIIGGLAVVIIGLILFVVCRIGITNTIVTIGVIIIFPAFVGGMINALALALNIEVSEKVLNAICIFAFVFAIIFMGVIDISIAFSSNKVTNQQNAATASVSQTNDPSQAIVNTLSQYCNAMSNSDSKKLYSLIYGDIIAKKLHAEDISEIKYDINSFNQKLKDKAGMTTSASNYALTITNKTKLSNEELKTIATTYYYFYELLDVKSDASITDGYAVITDVKFNNVSFGTHVFNVIKLNNEWKIDCNTSFVGGAQF